jgi:hypothetical protein
MFRRDPTSAPHAVNGLGQKDATFAQKLANALGRPVLAPTGNVVLRSDGKTWLRWGYYKEFRPEKK